MKPPAAKAQLRDVRKADQDWRRAVGRAIQRAVALRGWSLKEFAVAVDRDPRQCARWLSGGERPQLDALFSVEDFRHPLVQALGELAGADVEVTVRLRMESA
jgi:transcriptional regulator with XRE-family HTH domain